MNTTIRCMLLAALLVPAPGRADGYLETDVYHTTLMTAGWDLALPTARLRSGFIDQKSLGGASVGFRFGLRPQVSMGFDLAWNHFSQSDAVGDRKLDAFAARVTWHRYLSATEIQPYFGGGIGAVWREAGFVTGPYASGLGACIAPELGVLLTVGRGLALDVSARYVLTTANIEFAQPPIGARYPQWFGVHVGVGIY